MLRLFRQRRPFDLQQVVGFLLIGGALGLYLTPNTMTLVWLSGLWGIPNLWLWVVLLYLVCGYSLCLLTHTSGLVFGLLTMPLLLYCVMAVSSAVINGQPLFSGFMFGAFWLSAQYANARLSESA